LEAARPAPAASGLEVAGHAAGGQALGELDELPVAAPGEASR
jgi:hypothetical protein